MNKIYEPKEDSFLLANKIKNMKSVKTLEVGIGSGIVTNELIKISKTVIGTDISYHALLEYKKSPNKNKIIRPIQLKIGTSVLVSRLKTSIASRGP